MVVEPLKVAEVLDLVLCGGEDGAGDGDVLCGDVMVLMVAGGEWGWLMVVVVEDG